MHIKYSHEFDGHFISLFSFSSRTESKNHNIAILVVNNATNDKEKSKARKCVIITKHSKHSFVEPCMMNVCVWLCCYLIALSSSGRLPHTKIVSFVNFPHKSIFPFFILQSNSPSRFTSSKTLVQFQATSLFHILMSFHFLHFCCRCKFIYMLWPNFKLKMIANFFVVAYHRFHNLLSVLPMWYFINEIYSMTHERAWWPHKSSLLLWPK